MNKTIKHMIIISCLFFLVSSLVPLSSVTLYNLNDSVQHPNLASSLSIWYPVTNSHQSTDFCEQVPPGESLANGVSSAEVLFTGKVITNETANDFPICYGLPHCNVTITTIHLDPENLLSISMKVSICYNKSRMIPPTNLTVGDKIEVYGIFHNSTGPFQYVGHILIAVEPYYVKLLDTNSPPNIPLKPSGSTTGKVLVLYPYYVRATDPDGDRVRYRFEWGDGTYSIWSDLYPSGTLAYTYHFWSQPGSYHVRAQAMDEYGVQSMWSEPLTVNITGGNSAPNTPPRPTGSTSGTPRISYTYSVVTTDPEGDQISYYFDWGDGLGTWTSQTPSGKTVSRSHSWESTGIYYIRVKAKDEQGAESDWSPSLTVGISGNTPPNQPAKPSGLQVGKRGRSYSYTSVAIDIDDDRIYYLFDWGDGTDSGWVGPYASGQTATASHIWDNPGAYPIKVKAKDIAGEESVWSEPLSLVMPKIMLPRWLSFYEDLITWILGILS
jgi:hypothetical protein